ncbi:Syntaxin/t-SNARE family protein [Hibiscus syriacus]|uniref:Syntaxin/t-SNARE family protein n=1 Tax=Hibiscus syriacus TaxID=106335 RepID=A0A6A2X5C4_HIBSY|nr:phosphatidylinositol-glycan biosynthesis class X protein-like [Hibiscus syriacus]KAE8657236.1 Syntaxin/t-SNARE family protein [Hibiscus syriacus]
MSTPQCNRLCLHQKLAILWIFFSGAIVSSSEVKTSQPSDSQNSDDGKYIMRSYFDNHENLHDSSFENFMTRELSSSLCIVNPENQNRGVRLSVRELSLNGEGSHRQLSLSIRLQTGEESIPELPPHKCEVIVIQRLPLGVFADPFELQNLHKRMGLKNVAVFGDTNLELPSFRSNRSAVEIHIDAGSDILFMQSSGMEINILLPLHARYQPLDESGYSIIQIGEPDMLMRCNIEGKQDKQSCLFMSLEDSAKSRISTVEWKIPAGMKAHTGFVSVVTFITASLSTVSIVYTSMFWSGTKT